VTLTGRTADPADVPAAV